MVFSLNVCFSVSISFFSLFSLYYTSSSPIFQIQSKATNYFSLTASTFTCSTSFSPFLTFSFLKNRSNKQVVALHEDPICGFATICNLFIWMLGFFLIFFFLYLFFFLLVCTSTKHFYRPKQPEFTGTADTRPIRLVLFPVQNKGCTCTGALASTLYTGCTGRYNIELASMSIMHGIILHNCHIY